LNNFYTVLIIPEKTKQVKKIVLPSVYVRVGLLLGSVGIFFLAFMVYDYVNVMRQLSENKRLQTENRQLKQQMQAFTTKLQTVQDALERIQSYTTKLRIITNQAGDNTENLKKKVAPDIPGLPMDDHSDLPPAKAIPSGRESRLDRSKLNWPFDRSRLLASNDESAASELANENFALPPSEKEPVVLSVNEATSTSTSEAAPSAIVPPALKSPAAPAEGSAPAIVEPAAPAPVVIAKPKRKPKPQATEASTSTSTSTIPNTSTATSASSIPAKISKAKSTATASSTATSLFTSTSTSANTSTVLTDASPAESTVVALPEPPKRLSDLIREDEEKESAALRRDFAKLHMAFDSVLQHELAVELDVESLTTALLDQRDYMNSLPTLKPTNGWYTSGFGVRSSPFTGKSTMHEGLDLANHIGSAIVSAAAGVVTFAGPRPGYGNLVTINHGYGIQTQYGHISRAYVKVGEKVKRGQKIAAVGNTGRSTGPHCHYEVRVNGIPMDPYYYILEE